jgi:probable selenium-dependent hydroxylase accessory protein YqeC
VIPACCDALVIVAGLHGLGQPLDDAHLFRAGQWAALTGAVPGTPVSGEDLVRVVTHAHGLARGCPDGALQCLFLNRADTPARLDAARRIEQTLARVPGCRVTRVVAGSLLPRLRLAA